MIVWLKQCIANTASKCALTEDVIESTESPVPLEVFNDKVLGVSVTSSVCESSVMKRVMTCNVFEPQV